MPHAKEIEKLNADFTSEIIVQVDDIIGRHAGKPGCLIPVLTECQAVAGYLPVELQEYIAEGLNIPGSTIYGVVTFYSFFPWCPKGGILSRYVWELPAMCVALEKS